MLRLSLVIGGLLVLNAVLWTLVWWLDKREARRATVQARLDAFRIIEAKAWKEDTAARARRLHVDELMLDEDFAGFAELGRPVGKPK